MKRIAWAAAASAALLAGCTIGPDYRRTDTAVPIGYASAPASTAPAVDPWWALFNDPVLDGLIKLAFAQNLDLAAADARIRQARAAFDASRANGLPRIDAGASAQEQRLSENGAQLNNLPPNVNPDLQFPVYRAHLDASWELDLWGRQRRRNEAANARAEAAAEARRDAAVRVASEVARNYAEMRAAVARLAVANANVDSLRTSARLVEQRVATGEDAQPDANRIASELREAQAALPALEAERRAALFAIDLLIGATPGTAERHVEAGGAPAPLRAPEVAVGLPSDLLRRRPDVARAERELAAETADIGVAVADLYPRFSLTGTLGLESVRAGDFLNSASRYWQVGPSLMAPLFDGGARRANVRREQAQRDEAVASYQQAVLRALSDVETAITRLARERERSRVLAAARDEMVRSRELVEQRYRVGESDRLEVLESERRVLRLSDLVAQSDARVVTYTIALQKALGGGWESASMALPAPR